MEKICLVATENVNLEKANRIAEKLKIDIVSKNDIKSKSQLILQLDETGLSLIGNNMVLHGDFSKMIRRIKTNNLQSELLIKASKIKGKQTGLTVLDATAGMGEDSFLLAAYGFEVNLYESNPIIAMLLQDTIERASNDKEIAYIVQRMHVYEEDSIKAMKNLSKKPDIIYLDPMFPERNKSSLIKKKFQLLQQLECPCLNEDELLQSAINVNPYKIVIKRPLKGPYLADVKPSYSLKGNSIRYDCLVM